MPIPQRSAPGSPEPVRVVASSCETRRKRVVESDEEGEEDDLGFSSKKQKIQQVKSSSTAPARPPHSASSSSTAIFPHLLPAPSPMPSSDAPVMLSGASPISNAEEISQPADATATLPSSSPVFIYEPSEVSANSPTSFLGKSTTPASPVDRSDTAAQEIQVDQAMTSLDSAENEKSPVNGCHPKAGATSIAASPLPDALASNEDTLQTVESDSNMAIDSVKASATKSVPNLTGSLEQAESEQSGSIAPPIPGASESGDTAALAVPHTLAATTVTTSFFERPSTPSLGTELIAIPIVQLASMPATDASQGLGSEGNTTVARLPESTLLAQPATHSDVESVLAVTVEPITQTPVSISAPPSISAHTQGQVVQVSAASIPPGPTSATDAIETAHVQTPAAAPAASQVVVNTSLDGSVTPATPINALTQSPMPIPAPVTAVATIPPAASTITSAPAVQANGTANIASPHVAPAPIDIPVLLNDQGDLPVEVHEWRDFLLANGIETVADLRVTFYGDGQFIDTEVKDWLAWVAEDPKTALASRSLG